MLLSATHRKNKKSHSNTAKNRKNKKSLQFGHNKTYSIKKREEIASWPCKSKIDVLFLKFHDFIYCLGYVQVCEGRNQTLPEWLKTEFRLTMNLLQTTISEDMYKVIDLVIGRTNFDRRQFNVIIFEFVPYYY